MNGSRTISFSISRMSFDTARVSNDIRDVSSDPCSMSNDIYGGSMNFGDVSNDLSRMLAKSDECQMGFIIRRTRIVA